MKVLLIIDHAPDYREGFFRELGSKCDLSIVAQPCKQDNLTPPEKRAGYNYYDIKTYELGPFRFCLLPSLIKLKQFDIICVDFNLRHLWRFYYFFKHKSKSNWIWWGHIYGRNDNKIFNFVRKAFLNRAAGILAQSKAVSERLHKNINVDIIESFNNTQIEESDFVKLDWKQSNFVNLLFVGRPQERKRLGRLIKMAIKYSEVQIRLIGPGMYNFLHKNYGDLPDNIQCYDKTEGKELLPHFEWCHAVVNPGHLGLLVTNAAKYGRAIIIQKNTRHAPEYIMAEESGQYFIDFDSDDDTNWLFNEIKSGGRLIQQKAAKLQNLAKKEYTIQYMAQKHIETFRKVIQSNNLWRS